jgi:hypothetical protein
MLAVQYWILRLDVPAMFVERKITFSADACCRRVHCTLRFEQAGTLHIRHDMQSVQHGLPWICVPGTHVHCEL